MDNFCIFTAVIGTVFKATLLRNFESYVIERWTASLLYIDRVLAVVICNLIISLMVLTLKFSWHIMFWSVLPKRLPIVSCGKIIERKLCCNFIYFKDQNFLSSNECSKWASILLPSDQVIFPFKITLRYVNMWCSLLTTLVIFWSSIFHWDFNFPFSIFKIPWMVFESPFC